MQPTQKQIARTEKLAHLYAKGLSCAEVGARVGMSVGGVWCALRRLGVACRPRGRLVKDAPQRTKEIIALYRHGQTLQAIGDQFNVTRERIRQLLRKAGVDVDMGGQALHCLLSLDKARAKRDARDARLFEKWGLTLPEYKALVAQYGSTTTSASPLYKFKGQRSNARTRGIAWEITFKEWWTLWQDSGHWEQRGRGKGYCMARIGDSGPYSVDNVEIITIGQNFSDSYLVSPWHERFSGVHGNKTHCKRGHAFTPENTASYPSANGRTCKACASIRAKKWAAKQKAEQMAA